MRGIKTVGSSNTYFLYDESGHPLVEETYSGSTATMSAVNAFGADGWRERWEYPQVYGYSFDPQGTLVSRGTYVSFGPYATNDTAVYGAYGDLRADFRYGNNTETNYRDPVGFEGQYGYYGEFLAPVYTTGTAGRVPHYISLLTHRYYSPSTGEFINRDPIGTKGGENLYGYAGGNPVNRVDPSGHGWLYNAFWNWIDSYGKISGPSSVTGGHGVGTALSNDEMTSAGVARATTAPAASSTEAGTGVRGALTQGASMYSGGIPAGEVAEEGTVAAQESRASSSPISNAILPRNGKLAGQNYPLSDNLAAAYPSGVQFKPTGYPDFSQQAVETVSIEGGFTTRRADFAKANKLLVSTKPLQDIPGIT